MTAADDSEPRRSSLTPEQTVRGGSEASSIKKAMEPYLDFLPSQPRTEDK